MKPLNRRSVDKRGSVVQFKHNVSRTHPLNFAGPMRGGIRL